MPKPLQPPCACSHREMLALLQCESNKPQLCQRHPHAHRSKHSADERLPPPMYCDPAIPSFRRTLESKFDGSLRPRPWLEIAARSRGQFAQQFAMLRENFLHCGIERLLIDIRNCGLLGLL